MPKMGCQDPVDGLIDPASYFPAANPPQQRLVSVPGFSPNVLADAAHLVRLLVTYTQAISQDDAPTSPWFFYCQIF